MKRLKIIKIGGNVIDDAIAMENFLSDFSKIKCAKILVHGGGKLATDIAKRLGVSQALLNGRRITDVETLKITTMVYAGLINKQIVASLQSKCINAIGLSGADGNSIKTKKREVVDIDFGFVGDVSADSVNANFIFSLLEVGISPVFSAITHDGNGQLLNTNADTIASALAIQLSKLYDVELMYCFEKKGVLKNAEDDSSVIHEITKTGYKQLLQEGIVSKGMIPKLDTAFSAIQNGVQSVVILHATDLLNKIYKNETIGTTLVA